jgi:dipeptidyl aminopeptidase/acylaminoacyl peptidase
MRRSLGAVVGVVAIGLMCAYAQGARMEMRDFFASRWTYQPRWSPDGEHLAFLQDDWQRQQIYVVAATGGEPRQVSKAERFVGDPRTGSAGQAPVWSPDSRELLYVQDGDIRLASIADGRVVALTATDDRESDPMFSPDGRTISYMRGGAVHLLDRSTGSVRQIGAGEGRGLGGVQWSPDGTRLAVSIGRSRPFTLVPSYVGRLISFPMSQPEAPDAGVIDLASGKLTLLASTPRSEAALAWSPDSGRLLVERMSDDYKEREILAVTVADGSTERVLAERDEKYLPLGRGFARFDATGRSVVYASDASGWNHLYRRDLSANTATPLTSGSYEVREAALAPDGWLYFVSGQVGASEPHVFKVAAEGGEPQRLTSHKGVHADVQVAAKAGRMAYVRSDPQSLPDIWVQGVDAKAAPVQVTQSNPPASTRAGWQEPALVTYRGHDGIEVKAQLFVPRRESGRRYPVIVHTHQAASYQDVYVGPGPQKDNVAWYAWHQRLAQLGYVVLNVDYRGSTGYGRDYRVANYQDLGGGDRLDAVSGVEYLKTLAYADTSRVGVYGMSYGGHLVLSLLTKNPGVFRAGIDISGVADMRMVYETAGRAAVVARLSTPDAAPDLYTKSSAISHLDQLRDPLMVLHGTDDPNVSILQSLKLVDELIRRGKRFEFEIYPGELHFFTRATTWIDAFAKMERFFDTEVRGGSAASSRRGSY